MVSADGRARVMDFGLAHTGDATPTMEEIVSTATLSQELRRGELPAPRPTLAGTPLYMAPEQLLGMTTGARTDQFSFCVALWEALHGARPFAGETLAELEVNVCGGRLREPPRGARVPRWLRRVCERGLRVDPEERWPTMAALLEALARGQSRARTRRGIFAATLGVALASAAFGARAVAHQRLLAACAAEGAAIEEAWPGRAATVRDGILATGAAYAETTVAKITPWLDRWVAGWRASRVETCVAATVDASLDEALYRRSQVCFDLKRAQLEALLERLELGEEKSVRNAVSGASSLPSLDACADPLRLAREAWPDPERWDDVLELRARLMTAQSLDSTAQYDHAVAVARAALADAAAIGWTPLVAESRGLLGLLLTHAAEYEASAETLQDAYFEAGRVGADEVAADAATNLTATHGHRLAAPEVGLSWARHADMLIARLDARESMRAARALHNLGLVHWTRGDYDAALAQYERALAIKERLLDPDHPELAGLLHNIALVHATRGAYDRALPLYQRALEMTERALGPDHPDVAATLGNLAYVHRSRGDLEVAWPLYERALAIEERALGRGHPVVAGTLSNLADMHQLRGAYDQAVPLYQRALEILERTLAPDHQDTATVLNNLGMTLVEQEQFERAGPLFTRALASWERSFGAEHPLLAYPLTGLGEVALAGGRPAEAAGHLKRALELRVGSDVSSPEDLAQTRFAYARALWELGEERARVVELAEEAARVYADADALYAGRRAQVNAFLARAREASPAK